MDGYWQTRPADLVKAEMFADWMDALQNYSPDEIRAACREYLAGPDCARKPKPGDIRAIIQSARRAELERFRASQPNPIPEPEMSPEELAERRRAADEIMARFRTGRSAAE